MCINVWGFDWLILSDITKLFHFHRIFKNGGGGWVARIAWTPPPPLDPPMEQRKRRHVLDVDEGSDIIHRPLAWAFKFDCCAYAIRTESYVLAQILYTKTVSQAYSSIMQGSANRLCWILNGYERCEWRLWAGSNIRKDGHSCRCLCTGIHVTRMARFRRPWLTYRKDVKNVNSIINGEISIKISINKVWLICSKKTCIYILRKLLFLNTSVFEP